MRGQREDAVTPKELEPIAFAQLSPPNVSNPSDNLKNLFEVPTLFYGLFLYLFVTQRVDTVYINAAWIFVGFRFLHSVVHCTFNRVMLRFYLYLLGTDRTLVYCRSGGSDTV